MRASPKDVAVGRARATRMLRLSTALLLLVPAVGNASFLAGEALDSLADAIAWGVLVIAPVVGIGAFWMVHILPEKIAEKKHHPQAKAIQVLCLLSLVFGGLLWPIAWLWAYSKPVLHKMAYGTDKHEDHYLEMADKVRDGSLVPEEIARLSADLEAMERRGALPAKLRDLKDELARVRRADAPARALVASSKEGRT